MSMELRGNLATEDFKVHFGAGQEKSPYRQASTTESW